LLNIGGVSCGQEFGDFLAANPTYTEIPDPGPGNLDFYNQIFICTDNGVRFYNKPQPTCFEELISFLQSNINFGALSQIGVVEFIGETDLNRALTIFEPGSGYYRFFCNDPNERYAIFDRYNIPPGDLIILDSNPSWLIQL